MITIAELDSFTFVAFHGWSNPPSLAMPRVDTYTPYGSDQVIVQPINTTSTRHVSSAVHLSLNPSIGWVHMKMLAALIGKPVNFMYDNTGGMVPIIIIDVQVVNQQVGDYSYGTTKYQNRVTYSITHVTDGDAEMTGNNHTKPANPGVTVPPGTIPPGVPIFNRKLPPNLNNIGS